MASELKPCPFCGGNNIAALGDNNYHECRDCGAYGPCGDEQDQGRSAWNTRKGTNNE